MSNVGKRHTAQRKERNREQQHRLKAQRGRRGGEGQIAKQSPFKANLNEERKLKNDIEINIIHIKCNNNYNNNRRRHHIVGSDWNEIEASENTRAKKIEKKSAQNCRRTTNRMRLLQEVAKIANVVKNIDNATKGRLCKKKKINQRRQQMWQSVRRSAWQEVQSVAQCASTKNLINTILQQQQMAITNKKHSKVNGTKLNQVN